jgi:hypothetical protein
MIQRRAKAAGIETRIGCHTFRATSIIAYLKNKGTLEHAQYIANHESPARPSSIIGGGRRFHPTRSRRFRSEAFYDWPSGHLAHDIAGNRYFPGTLTFDDPAVTDELFIPLYDRVEHPPREGGKATDDAFSPTFLRSLMRRLAISGDATWLSRCNAIYFREGGGDECSCR